MRNLSIILLLILASCKKEIPEMTTPDASDTTVTSAEAPKPLMEIIPGEKIGNIRLEMPASDLDFLGDPDLSDAAMGKAWLTWYSDNSDAVSGKFELNIFTAYKDDEMKEKVVRLIRATSPEFMADSIGSGKNLQTIRTRFPDIENVGDYAFGHTKDIVSIYDDRARGIAFELVKDSCIGVLIHPKGKDVTLDYRSFRPDMSLR